MQVATSPSWTRVKGMERDGIIGWFERRIKLGDFDALEGIVTLTKGQAHIVLRGQCFVSDTPESQFGVKPETIMERLSRFLR